MLKKLSKFCVASSSFVFGFLQNFLRVTTSLSLCLLSLIYFFGFFLSRSVAADTNFVTSTNFSATTNDIDGNAYIGPNTNGINVTVENAANLNITQGLFIGSNGTNNSMLVTGSNSVVTNDNASIGLGTTPGDGNNAIVTDNGEWSNAGTLTIGETTNGTVTVADSGNLQADTILLASNSGTTGTLNIGSNGVNSSAGTIDSATITNGDGAGIINFNQSNETTLSSVIAGDNVTINQLGTGTSTLTGTNTYSGTNNVNQGTLVAGSDTALGDSGNKLNVNSSTVDFGGHTVAQGAVDLSNANLINGTLSQSGITASNGINTVGVAVSGTGGFTNTGGTATLSASNSYSGETAVSGGGITISGSGTLGATTNSLALSGDGVLNLGTTTQTQGSVALDGGTIQNGTLNQSGITASGGSNTIDAVIAGTGGFTNSGGTSTLSQINTFTGGTVIGGGDVRISGTGTLGNTNNDLTISGGSILDLGATTQTQGSVVLGGGTIQAGTLNQSGVTASSGSNTVGVILDGTGGFTNSGTATSSLTEANNYTGGTTVTGGLLTIGNISSLGNETNSLAVGSGGTLNLATLEVTQGNVTLTGGTLQDGTLNQSGVTASSGSNSVGVILSGTGGFTNSGTATSTLTEDNTYTGGNVITGGRVNVEGTLGNATNSLAMRGNSTLDLGGNSLSQGTVSLDGSTIQNGTLNQSGGIFASSGSNILSAVVAGDGGLSVTGGTTTLSALNTYTGGTTASGNGTVLVASANSALGNQTNSLTLSNGASLNIEGAITLNQGGVVLNNATLNDAVSSGGILSGTSFTFTGTNNIEASLAGTGGVTQTGGSLNFTASNSYSGGNNFNNTTVNVSDNGTLGATNAATIMSNTTLNIGSEETVGALTLDSSTIASNGTIAFDTANLTGTNTISAGLNGSGTININDGLTTLSGNGSGFGGTANIGIGTMNLNSTNALGGSSTLNLGTDSGGTIENQVLAIGTNSTVGTFNWHPNSTISQTDFNGTVNAQTFNMTEDSGTYNVSNNVLDNRVWTLATYTNKGGVYLDRLTLNGVDSNSVLWSDTGSGLNYQISTNATVYIQGDEMLDADSTFGNINFATNPASKLTILRGDHLNITSNFTMAANSTLAIQLGATSEETPIINSGGTNTFRNNLVLELAPNTLLGSEHLLSRASSWTADFSSVSSDSSHYIRLVDPDTDLYAVVAPAYYRQMAVTQNQLNVANALQSFRTPATEIYNPNTATDSDTVSTALDYLNPSEYQSAFNQIMPGLYASLPTMNFNTVNAQNQAITQQLNLERAEGKAFSNVGLRGSAISDDSNDAEGSNKDILKPSKDNRWGVAVTGNGIFANYNIQPDLGSYNSSAGGVTASTGYRWNKDLLTGLYAGYQGAQAKYTGGSSLVDNGTRFGLFGSYHRGGFFGNAMFGGNAHSYQVDRCIDFQGDADNAIKIDRTATSSPNAAGFDTMLTTGYDHQMGHLTAGPLMSLQYAYFNVNSFSEANADSLNLSVDNQEASSLIYTLGSHLNYTLPLNKRLLLTPFGNLSWQHEFLQDSYTFNSTLQGGGGSFGYTTTAPNRDSLFTGVGVGLKLDQKYDLSFTYNASAANSDLVSQNIFLTVGMSF